MLQTVGAAFQLVLLAPALLISPEDAWVMSWTLHLIVILSKSFFRAAVCAAGVYSARFAPPLSRRNSAVSSNDSACEES